MKKKSPILLNVPHSSTFIPNEEMKYFVTDRLEHELLVMTDHYCDDLFDDGYEMIRFPVSRLVCDFERFRDDQMESMSSKGMGVCYVSCSDQKTLRRLPAKHREEIIQKYYDTYHKALELSVEERLGKRGCCLIIDGHSFYESPLPYEFDQSPQRPDICIGTDEYHTPIQLSQYICSFFENKGYTVALNSPFAGTIVPMKYFRVNSNVKSVMIELNRRLYIDRQGTIHDGYLRIKADIAELLDKLDEFMIEPFLLDTPGGIL